MDIESSLRSLRKALVTAAEAAIRDTGSALPEKTQLNRLAAICGEATCAEEIISFLYYQCAQLPRASATEPESRRGACTRRARASACLRGSPSPPPGGRAP